MKRLLSHARASLALSTAMAQAGRQARSESESEPSKCAYGKSEGHTCMWHCPGVLLVDVVSVDV
jgi:hypothetical protein